MITHIKKFVPIILIFTNCATTYQRWSQVSQPPERLTGDDKGNEVILILKNKQQIKQKYHVSPVKRILATMVIAFVIAYYFAMKDFGDALS